jgi:hypothetical protein
MVDAQIIIYITGVILFSMNLFIGSYLLLRIRKTGLSNIYWLSFYFFFTVIEYLLRMLYAAGRPSVGLKCFSSKFCYWSIIFESCMIKVVLI